MKDKVLAFDTLFTTNAICKLKILLTYLEPSVQKQMAILIKYLELQYTITFYQKSPHSNLKQNKDSYDMSQLCRELTPYCDQTERTQMQSLQNTLSTFENMKEMMEMAEMLKGIMPDDVNDLAPIFQMFDWNKERNTENGNNEAKTGMDEGSSGS